MDILFGEVSVDELFGQNKRLKSELLFTNKCLNVLIRFKTFVDSLILEQLKDKISANDCQKYEILSNDVNEMKESLFKQKFYFNQIPDNESTVKTYVCRRPDCGQRFESSEEMVRHIEEKCDNNSEAKTQTKAETKYENKHETKPQTSEAPDSEVSESSPIGSPEDLPNDPNETNGTTTDRLVEEGTQTDESQFTQSLKLIDLPLRYTPARAARQLRTPRTRGRPRASLQCDWPGCDFKISDSRKKARLEAHINDHKGISPYVCDHVGCGLGFKSRDFLRKHKKSHMDLLQEAMCKALEPNVKLEVQDDGYGDAVDVLSFVQPNMQYNGQQLTGSSDQDMAESSSQNEALICTWPGCDYRVTDVRYKSRLIAHINQHKGITPFICDHVGCGLGFSSKENLQKHFRRTHDSKAFVCEFEGCGQRFQRRYRLVEHMSRHTGDYKYECGECHKKFVKRDTMNQHMDRMHKVLDEPLVCDFENCNKEFATQMAFKVHQMKVHLREKRFVCDEPNCQFRTVSNDKLGRHKQTVHQKERPFACEFDDCPKTFVDHLALEQHTKRVHSTELGFRCPHEGCDKAYRLQCDLNAHIRLKHLATKVKCAWPGCEFTAPNTPILKYHEADVHMGIRNFKCEWPECGKAFKRKWHLKEHMRMHNNERPYACPWPGCGYRAVTSGTLSGHVKVHNKHIKD